MKDINNDYLDDHCKGMKDELDNASSMEEKGDIVFKFLYTNRARYAKFLSQIANELRIEAEEEKCNHTVGWCCFVLGWLKHDEDLYDDSMQLFLEAQKRFIKCGNKDGLSRAINGEAAALRYCGRYDMALEKYLQSLELAEELKTDTLISAICSNLGALLFDLKLYEEALIYLNRAMSLEQHMTLNKAIQLNNIGKIYKYLSDFTLAEKCFLDSLEFCYKEKHPYFETAFTLETGILKREQGMLDKAKEYLNKVRESAHEQNLLRFKAVAMVELGLIAIKEKDAQVALELLLDSLDIFNVIKAKDCEAQALAALAEVYGSMGDYQNAYKTYSKVEKLKTEIYNEDIANKMGAMKVKQARQEDEIYRNMYHQINIISKIGQAITSTFDIKEMGAIFYRNLQSLMDVDNLAVGIYSKDRKFITYKIYIKKTVFEEEIITPLEINCLQGEKCLFNKKGIIVNDIWRNNQQTCSDQICNSIPLDQDINSFICSSMVVNDKSLGLITVQSNKKDIYLDYHVDMLNAIASYAAIALANEQLFSHVNKLATTDGLTRCLNRHSIFKRAREEFSRYIRHRIPLVVAMIDIDKFKNINDKYGHHVGDLVLRDVCNIIEGMIRKNDILGRLGGDEFLLVFPDTVLDEAVLLTNRLLKEVSKKEYNIGGKVFTVKISLGLTEAQSNDKDVSETINRADKALYKAKEVGGGKIKKMN